MSNNDDELVHLDGRGRKPNLRDLKLGGGAAGKGGKGKRPRLYEYRPVSWGAEKNMLRLLVQGAPEVVIVKDPQGGKTDAHVKQYMDYITREGELPAQDELGLRVHGQPAVDDAYASWNLDLQRKRSARHGLLHQSHNFVFSMPRDTDPDGLYRAVLRFAERKLAGHQYLLVLHDPATDPKAKPSEHPHVHLILRAEDDSGRRLHTSKATLRAWRVVFAEELRAQGIAANATPRSWRGVSQKKMKGAEYHIRQRDRELEQDNSSTALARRFAEAAQDLRQPGRLQKPWEIAMAARRRDVQRDLAVNAARLREEGEHALASEVEHFVAALPPLTTERHQMQRALVEQVDKRAPAQEKSREPDA
jgi:hypothetical protein